MESAEIAIEIIRAPALTDEYGAHLTGQITGFVVRDNGEGFHDDNMTSFETLDSEYKLADGGRGVGRLLWLKAFDRVQVRSCYQDGQGEYWLRSFRFSEPVGTSQQAVEKCGDESTWAEVRLASFRDAYRRVAPKTAAKIANSILEHCLWYFVRPGGAPNITIVDGTERLELNSLYDEYILTSSNVDTLSVKGKSFDLVHLRLKANARAVPQLCWCASNRVVTEENLAGKVVGLHGRLKDLDGEFVYVGFLMADYLDANVRAERTEFNIPESTADALDESEPSLSDIRGAALASVAQYLQASLKEARKAGRERVERFVDNKEPRYRPILRRIDEEVLSVDPEISDRDLELQLHRALAEIEHELLVEGQHVLDSSARETADYHERLRAYLDRVEDVKRSDLAAYVSRRRVILDLFAHAIRTDESGRYANEDVIHNLVMPMRSNSDEVTYGASNLWIIDERLAFHNYLASDKPIRTMPITESNSRLEPDILALRVVEGPMLVSEGEIQPASIVVVEFKRPMRNDAEDPIFQSLRYLRRVREGGVTTATGRPIRPSEHIPGFCYIIADLTKAVEERCMTYGLRPTDDRMGYFGYNDNYHAYIEVASLDRLLKLAHQRNRAFFERLGLPTG